MRPDKRSIWFVEKQSYNFSDASRNSDFNGQSIRRSDKHMLCDSFNIQNGKNYAMFSICEYCFRMQNKIDTYIEPMIGGEVFCLNNIKIKISPMFSGEVILSA